MTGCDDLTGCPLPDAFWIAITPYVIGQYALMALIDLVANSLSHQMGGNRKQAQSIPVKQFPAALAIEFVRLIDFHMISPAGQLKAIISKRFGFLANHFQIKVCPLSGE
jgi:hypothetical protein